MSGSLQRGSEPLTSAELDELERVFPELSWMGTGDWQAVASFSDWRSWIDEYGWNHELDEGRELYCMLKLRKNRVHIRASCRGYYGKDNIPNINDPDEETWA